MKLILKYGGISFIALLIVSCGDAVTTDTSNADNTEVVNSTVSYRSTFESITNNFNIEDEEGLKSISLTRFAYSGNLKSEAINNFIASTTAIDFVVEDRDTNVNAEYEGYENSVLGVLSLGDIVINAAFYFTNTGSEAINGIIVFDTPESLAFVKSEQVTIMIKGRQ